jgi:transcriptional regulator with XRE-family HTH domain
MGEFKDRLQQAVNKSSLIPEYGHGQQVTLAKLMEVSQEAVRKWMVGETRPRPDATKKLAQVLDVEHIWLMGHDDIEVELVKDSARRQCASLYAYVSYVIQEGGAVAFNTDSNDTSDLTLIKSSKVSVSSPIRISDNGMMEFNPPTLQKLFYCLDPALT